MSKWGTDDGRQALTRLEAAWLAEQQEARARSRAEREQMTLKERVALGTALDDLAVDEAEPAVGRRTLLWLYRRRARLVSGLTRLRAGDPVILWRRDPTEAAAVRGVVQRWRGELLGVIVEGEWPETLMDEGFRLDREAPESTFKRGERAVRLWAKAADHGALDRMVRVAFADGDVERLEGREAQRASTLQRLDPDLNAQQREAVKLSLIATPFALIHGPPGTGKTRTLVEVVRQWHRRGATVLVTAASNTAVDNLAERLIALGVPAIRLGHPARVLPAVEPHTLDAMVDRSEVAQLARQWIAQAQRLQAKARSRQVRGPAGRAERSQKFTEARRLFRDARRQLRGAQDAVLARHPVICATAAGADGRALRGLSFDVVVMDEATQAADPMAMVALMRAPRAVLAGDPLQLPPTVVSKQALGLGLGETLFERISRRCPQSTVLLTVQHRMPTALMRFPSASIYGGQLVAAATVADRGLQELDGIKTDDGRPHPLAFVDTAGKGWDERSSPETPSVSNPEQAERVAHEVERLVSRGIAPSQIGVIATYRAQVQRLRQRLLDLMDQGLEIDTVDGFQGREKDCVVVDLVRSNADRAIGFVADKRRMNVALTRARRFLLVIGDSATFGGHDFFDAFMQSAEADGAWLSAWSDGAEPLE